MIELINAIGESIMKTKPILKSGGNHEEKISLNGLTSGAYFVKLTTTKKAYQQKLIKI